jgi:molybdate transport system permease protein
MITPGLWQILGLTLWVSLLATVLIFPFAIALAWLFARRSWPGKSLVETLVSIPLVMPPVATGLLLLILFGKRGVIGGFLEKHLELEIVFTWKAVVLALGVMAFPLLARSARVAFEEVDARLEDVASTLGASPWRVFLQISFPLAARGIISGVLLAFARALGEFGATIVVAGNIPGQTTTIPLAIYQSIQLGRDSEAVQLLVLSVVISFLAVWLSQRFAQKPASR